MLTFSQQEKILGQILKNPANKECADCNTISPTWASLNFGVFLCSNCSGAHRALGPTVTRVKSTKLDQWNKQWVQNMRIGNKQLNQYWQSQLGMTRKPKMGASQNELFQYISSKYLKKKFVKDLSIEDPLTQYQKGTYKQFQNQTKNQLNLKKAQTIKKQQDQKSNVAVEQQQKVLDLLDFQVNEPNYETQSQTNNLKVGYVGSYNNNRNQPNQMSANNSPMRNQQDEFTEYTEVGTSFTGTSNNDNISYDDLIVQNKRSTDNNEFKLPALHHVHSANFSYQNPYYGQIGHNHFNIANQPTIHNNGGILHVPVSTHNYNQGNNFHYNHPPQVCNQVYGQHNSNLVNGASYTPSYHHPQQQYQSIPYQGINIGHGSINGDNKISHNININMNVNINQNTSTNSQQKSQNKHWTQEWK